MGILFHCSRTICLSKQEDQRAKIHSEETQGFYGQTQTEIVSFCNSATLYVEKRPHKLDTFHKN